MRGLGITNQTERERAVITIGKGGNWPFRVFVSREEEESVVTTEEKRVNEDS